MEQGYGGSSGWLNAGWRQTGAPSATQLGLRRGPRTRAYSVARLLQPDSRRGGRGARARCSLDLGAVAPGALRADWSARLEEAGGVWRADAAAGFGGRLGLSWPFLPFSPSEAGPVYPAARRLAFPFRRPQNGGARGRSHSESSWGAGSAVGARGSWGACLRPVGLRGGLRAVHVVGRAGPRSRPGGAASDLSPPVPRCSAVVLSTVSAGVSLGGLLPCAGLVLT